MVEAESNYETAVEEADEAKMDELDKEIALLEEKYVKFEKIHPFCYCSLSGTLGAQSIVCYNLRQIDKQTGTVKRTL